MRNNGSHMKLRMLALALALSCGLAVAADAKTRSVRHGAYQVKGSRHKGAKAHRVRPAVRRPKVRAAKRNH